MPDKPISTLSDARALVDAALAALDTVTTWITQLGHDALAGDLRRRTQDIAADFTDGLEHVRTVQPNLDDGSEPDDEEH